MAKTHLRKPHVLIVATLQSLHVSWLDKATLVRALLYSNRLAFRQDAKPEQVDEAIKLELTWLSPLMQVSSLGIFSALELAENYWQTREGEETLRFYVEDYLESLRKHGYI